MITTSDGVASRKMQACLKPYTPQNKKSQAVQSVSQLMAQSDHMRPVKQLCYAILEVIELTSHHGTNYK